MIKFRLKVVLALNDLNQRQLADKAGVRPTTISDICKGTIKHLPIEALDKICNALNCQPADIMEFIPSENDNAEA